MGDEKDLSIIGRREEIGLDSSRQVGKRTEDFCNAIGIGVEAHCIGAFRNFQWVSSNPKAKGLVEEHAAPRLGQCVHIHVSNAHCSMNGSNPYLSLRNRTCVLCEGESAQFVQGIVCSDCGGSVLGQNHSIDVQ